METTVINPKYFVRVERDGYTDKNKLQTAIKEVFRKYDRIALSGSIAKRGMLTELKQKLKELNSKYNRCTSLEIRQWRPGRKSEIISINGVTALVVTEIKEVV